MVVLAIGVAGVLQFFPPSIRANSDAALRGKAVLLAQKKIEEIRRDDTAGGDYIDTIRNLPNPTNQITFAEDPRLVYQFSSYSFRDPSGSSGDPEFDPNVPRIIVSFSPSFRDSDEVICEIRFDS